MASRTRFNEGTREISFRYDILDKNNIKKGEASNIVDGKVSFNAFSSIHRTASFKLREEAPPPESIPIVAGNTYTTTSFPPIGWTMDKWVNAVYGEIRPERITTRNINSEMEGPTSAAPGATGYIYEKWGVFKDSALATLNYRTDERGCIGNAQTIEKNGTGNYKAGIYTFDWVNTALTPTKANFCFMYRLTVNDAASSDMPAVWAIPETANQGNNWAGAVRVSNSNMTTRGMNNDWIFCEGVQDLPDIPGGGAVHEWKFAFGYESASPFKIKIDCVTVTEQISKRLSNLSISTSQVFDISYTKVVDGVVPTFNKAIMYYNLVPGQNNPAEVYFPLNRLFYRTSINGGSTWSAWTQAVKDVPITTIPAGSPTNNLKMQLQWEFDRYSMSDTKPRMRDLSIEVNYNAQGKNPLTDSIDYRVDRIRPYMIYKDGTSTIERSLGIFLMNSPKRKDEGSRVYREIEAYDQLSILADAKVIYAFETVADVTKPLTQLVTEILRGTDTTIPGKFGYGFPAAFVDITPGANGTLAKTMKFEVGQTWLDVINSMLTSINYTPLYATGDGVLTSKPYQLPENRPTSHTYLDDAVSIIYKQAEEEFDIHDVPNVFVCTQQADQEGERLYSRLFNNNVGSLSSIPNVGRYIVDYREVDNIANQGVLDTYCARIASEASQAYGKVIFRTALMPGHEYMNNIQLRYQNLRVNDIYTETDWTMDLKVGGQMEHRVRKVVRI
ncbi:hypothetical protein [Bacillus toyonensis]|uniref:hypothetical protein n=1 Tax=Bacillus toyonensis TaxID=155322 RepID=UPI000BF4FB3D|nr:hypothetical protein [Bacillus toyonensis]PFY49109.1 hypothetical protein COL55_13460 [Bacillus toyonensis]PFY86056.1 hypothetical protein COL62_02355 [Bacillus toyonensis]PHD51857.1 hypothetical protein COF75_07450 [Bacillus toyonensis]